MAATTARMNPLQFKDKNPYQTRRIYVNLPKWRTHPCTRIKRSFTLFAQLNDEGPRLRVAYQGVPGAYSEFAAEKAYPNCEPIPCQDFETCFLAVENLLVDRAVLPIENSTAGSISRNHDLLLRYNNLHIVGERKFRIRHCLLANPNVQLEDLKSVRSHPQALAQCENTLTNLGLVSVAVDDTAGAAKFEASMAENRTQDAIGRLKELTTYLRVLGSYPACDSFQ